MDYKDLNEINFLTIKTDFILDICDKGEKVGTNLRMFKELGVQYEEVFRMMLKSIEALKGRIIDGVIDHMFVELNNVYEVNDEKVNTYASLLNCYVKCDIENYDLEKLYTNDFANNVPVEFNMLFAPYYLNVLIDRYGELNEINRINEILKKSIEEFRVKYGR